MRRRRLLGTVGAGVLTSFAGCAATNRNRDGEPAHPLGGDRTTVRVDTVSETDVGLAAVTRDALDYWEGHGLQSDSDSFMGSNETNRVSKSSD